MRFRLVPKSSTLDDLELLQVQIFSEFCAIVGMFGRHQRLNHCQRGNSIFRDHPDPAPRWEPVLVIIWVDED